MRFQGVGLPFHRLPFSLRATILLSPIHLIWPAASADAQLQDDQIQVQESLEQAAGFLGQRRPREALDALRPIDEREPDNPWLWFYRGTAEGQLGHWQEAISAYDRALARLEELDHPDPWLADLLRDARRAVREKVFGFSLRTAISAYDRALDRLAGLDDPDPLFANQLRAHRRDARQQVFGFSLRTGLAYDSNVTYRGGGASAAPLVTGRGDALFATQVGIYYSPIADDYAMLTVGARAGDSWHFSIEEFDYQDYGAFVRYARRLSDRWTAAVRYDYDITYLGNEPFLSNHALSPSITYSWPTDGRSFQPTETNFYYRIDARDFLFDTSPALDRDGFANSVGIDQRFTIRRSKQSGGARTTGELDARARDWDLHAGYQFASVATEGSEFDRLTHLFYLGLDVPLTNPWLEEKDLTFRFNASWEIADYRHDSLLDDDGDERADLITRLAVVLSQQLVTDPHYGDLTLHAIVDWTLADSNVRTEDSSTPFRYDKVVYGLQLEWSF